MKYDVVVMIVLIIVMAIAIVILIKKLNVEKIKKNELAIDLAKAKSDLEFEKTIRDVRSEIYKKSETEKQNFENGDNRTKFNNAYRILHDNKS